MLLSFALPRDSAIVLLGWRALRGVGYEPEAVAVRRVLPSDFPPPFPWGGDAMSAHKPQAQPRHYTICERSVRKGTITGVVCAKQLIDSCGRSRTA